MNGMASTSWAPSGDWFTPATRATSKGTAAAEEFEAHLVGSLLESLEKTFASTGGGSGIPGGDNYNYLGNEALAQVVVKAGGFGIARMLAPHLDGPSKPGNVPRNQR